MTQVTDEKLTQFFSFQHDIHQRVLKGSLDPDAVMDVQRPLIGQMKIPGLNLSESSIIIPELKEKFDPNEHYRNGEKVKYHLWDNFKKYVLNPAKPFSNLPEIQMSKHTLLKNMPDTEIMEKLGISKESGKLMSREEILWTIAHLTSQQPSGELGQLLTNGYATIIGYHLCDDGVVRVVCVSWSSARRDWGCRAPGLSVWGGGSGVLSRN